MDEPGNVWGAGSASTEVFQAPEQQMEDFQVHGTDDPSVNIVSYFSRNDQNQRIKVTRTVQRQVKITRVRKAVQHRRLWDKFGMGVAGKYYSGETGDEYKVSTTEETTQFVKSSKASQNEAEKILADVVKQFFEEESGGGDGSRPYVPAGAEAGKAYVPPGMGGRLGGRVQETQEEVTSLRIANISNEMGEEKGLLHGLIKHQWKKVVYYRLQKKYNNQLKAFKEERETYKKRFQKEEEEFQRMASSGKINREKLLRKAQEAKRMEEIWKQQCDKVKKFEVKVAVLQEFVPGRIDRRSVSKQIEDVNSLPENQQKQARLRNKIRSLILDDLLFSLEERPMRSITRGISVNYDHRDEGYFAYVRFHNRQDAEEVMNVLKGQVIGNLIIRVEWAKPRRRRY